MKYITTKTFIETDMTRKALQEIVNVITDIQVNMVQTKRKKGNMKNMHLTNNEVKKHQQMQY